MGLVLQENNEINSNWKIVNTYDRKANLHKQTISINQGGLTKEETEIIDHLAQAYNLFIKLQTKHPCDNEEFMHGIHQCQQKIGMRVARRINPDVWFQPEGNE